MKNFKQLRESKIALEDMEILDNILSEMPIDDLDELSEGPFSRIGKFMMKRKLAKQVKKSNKDIAKHTDAQNKDKKYAFKQVAGPGDYPHHVANHPKVRQAHDRYQPAIDKAKKMADRSQKALNRLNKSK